MELSAAIPAIQQQISQGNLEEAYKQLLQLLESDPQYAELADIARINQADLYQLKSQTLKGTISSEDARLTTNQLSDKALELVRHLQAGKTSLEENIPPHSSRAWRYYLIGATVALTIAFVVWQILSRRKPAVEECPTFSETAELKVMILPFRQTGKEKDVSPEIDIMDGLNDMIDKTPGLRVRAAAEVNESYDINKDYPSSARAVEIAQNCNAQMLVWGKVNQSAGNDYTVNVRYRLLDAGGVRYAGDTTISRLLTVTQEAGWTRDVAAITRLLYMVLANQMRVPIAANLIQDMSPTTTKAMASDSLAPVDTSTSFVYADTYITSNKVDSAIAVYDKVLAYYPNNATALTKRGALLLKKEDFGAAARDLEAVPLNDKATAPTLRAARIKAFLKSEQPDKAQQEVQSAQESGSIDKASVKEQSKEIQDSVLALQARRDQMERLATQRPRDLNAHVNAAKTNLGLGDTDKALEYATEVLKKDPANLRAAEVAVEAHLQQGDTASALKTFRAAERAGANVKSIHFSPVIRPLIQKQRKVE